VLGEDWEPAGRAAQKLSIIEAPGWQLDSTAKNLRIIRETRAERGMTTTELDELLQSLAEAAR
jgi:hypothetical protein